VYVVLCGTDGQGKTSVINKIQDYGADAIFTREPYENIAPYEDPIEASYQFAMDRYRHMKDVIIPAKKAGKDIISDRSYICSLVYQSYDGVDLQFLMSIQPPNLVFPDAVIWLQGDANIAAQRSGEDAVRLAGIQRGYSEILNSYELPAVAWYPVSVDGKSIDIVAEEVMELINELKGDRK